MTRIPNVLKAAGLGAVLLPLLGVSTCTEKKVVDLAIGFPTTIRFVAEGEINDKMDMQTVSSEEIVNLKDQLDIPGALADAGFDVNDLDADELRLVQIFFRIIIPDPVANRVLSEASLTVRQGAGAPAILVSGFSTPAGVGNVADPEAWIEITDVVGAAGLTLLNDYIQDCLRFLQGGPPISDAELTWDWSAVTTPVPEPTNFQYDVRLVFQSIVREEFEIPFG